MTINYMLLGVICAVGLLAVAAGITAILLISRKKTSDDSRKS